MRHFIATIAVVSALFCVGITTSALAKPHEHKFAKPPKGAPLAQGELPHIKGIAPEIFANASEQAQIKALQIEVDFRESLHKATQKYRDERDKLELQKRILQVRLHHAKAGNDTQTTQRLLDEIFKNEQALTKNNQDERELRDKQEAQRIERIYTELRK